jgi:NAD(P)-dependent dehydrogenase (short-subunit alcohol dehydrogenase family)
MVDLKGKTAVVTGGNSGIGYATAQALKAAGAEVIITGRDAGKVERAAKELGVTGIVADSANVAALAKLADEVKTKFKSLDILFNNAGVFKLTSFGSLDEKVFDENMDINFKGAVFALEKLLPVLKDGASVINLSSAVATGGMANTVAYTASKAAINALTRVAATELAPRKIRVNTVSPGPIATPIFGKSGLSEEMIAGFGAVMQNRVPLKRFGEASEVAKLVAFLASDDSAYINGADITVDGAISINPM